jgi:hypothetical protein
LSILVHRSIDHSLRGSPGIKVLECIGVSVDSPTGTLHLTSAYLPGASHSRDDLQKFKGDLMLLTRQSSSFFVCGDFNSRHRAWNCSRANQAVKVFFDEMNSGNFTIHHPPTPTRIPLNSRHSYTLNDRPHLFQWPSRCFLHCHDDCSLFRPSSCSFRGRGEGIFFEGSWSLFRQILDENLNLNSNWM